MPVHVVKMERGNVDLLEALAKLEEAGHTIIRWDGNGREWLVLTRAPEPPQPTEPKTETR